MEYNWDTDIKWAPHATGNSGENIIAAHARDLFFSNGGGGSIPSSVPSSTAPLPPPSLPCFKRALEATRLLLLLPHSSVFGIYPGNGPWDWSTFERRGISLQSVRGQGKHAISKTLPVVTDYSPLLSFMIIIDTQQPPSPDCGSESERHLATPNTLTFLQPITRHRHLAAPGAERSLLN